MTDLTVNKNLIEKLQKTADQLKGNGDGKLDIHEKEAIQLFNYTIAELKNNGAINQATFKEAMGLYVNNPSKAEGSTNVENAKPKEMTKEEVDVAKKLLFFCSAERWSETDKKLLSLKESNIRPSGIFLILFPCITPWNSSVSITNSPSGLRTVTA
mgnify:CR=1 FL=1